MKPEEFKAMLEKSLKQQGVPTKQWEVKPTQTPADPTANR